YPASDVEALAGQLERLVRDPGLGARLAARGRRKLLELHTIETAIEPLVEELAARGLMAPRPLGERRAGERRRGDLDLIGASARATSSAPRRGRHGQDSA